MSAMTNISLPWISSLIVATIPLTIQLYQRQMLTLFAHWWATTIIENHNQTCASHKSSIACACSSHFHKFWPNNTRIQNTNIIFAKEKENLPENFWYSKSTEVCKKKHLHAYRKEVHSAKKEKENLPENFWYKEKYRSSGQLHIMVHRGKKILLEKVKKNKKRLT